MSEKNFPFKILGIADDKKAYFIDHKQWLQSWPLQTIDKKRLMVLGDAAFWKDGYSMKDRVNWDEATHDVMSMSADEEFDPDRVKGRGAWRSQNGDICYFDGNIKAIKGEYDPYWVFTRRVQQDIGLDKPHTSAKIRQDIYDLNKTFAYEDKYQAAKLLAWAALAPFCGAMYWRPAILLTSASGVGKSTIEDKIVRPLTLPARFSGGNTTASGIRQDVKSDACPVVVEELENDNKGQKERRDEILSLMRQSTSDDSPPIAHGTSDGGGIKYQTKCMFMLIGISPDISKEADANRIVKINLVQSKTSTIEEWHKKEQELEELLSPANCEGIRAFTFSNLGRIFDLAKRIQPMIQRATKESARFAVVEAQLIACIMIVWLGFDDNEDPGGWISEFYRDYEKVEKVDDLENLLTKLLDTPFYLNEETIKGQYNMRSVLRYLKNDKISKPNSLGDEDDIDLKHEDKSTLARIAKMKGFGICKSKDDNTNGEMMVFKNVQSIKDSLGGGSYYELMKRYDGAVETTASRQGKTTNCVVLRGVL